MWGICVHSSSVLASAGQIFGNREISGKIEKWSLTRLSDDVEPQLEAAARLILLPCLTLRPK
jgi:hypothetical protein